MLVHRHRGHAHPIRRQILPITYFRKYCYKLEGRDLVHGTQNVKEGEHPGVVFFLTDKLAHALGRAARHRLRAHAYPIRRQALPMTYFRKYCCNL